MVQILQPTPPHLDQLADLLSEGEIVAIPTETVYGLAGNALNPEAIARIYAAKGRPAKNPLIVHVHKLEQLEEIAHISEAAKALTEKFWPGPLTLVLKKKSVVPNSVTAGLDSVAVRMPSHPVYRELAERCPFPLAAPSANPFGYVSPTRAEHVEEQMGSTVDWILDGGSCDGGIESTIVSLLDPQNPILLRFGSISPRELEDVLKANVKRPKPTSKDTGAGLVSPGLMKQHYSPHTPVNLFENDVPTLRPEEALLFLDSKRCEETRHFSLSPNGDLKEVARNLYDQLQSLDKQGFQRIHLELPPDSGIGRAIRDRMIRAAAD